MNIQQETMSTEKLENSEETIRAMQEAANAFYKNAVRIGNHPFIEFAGLMNEYINACSQAADEGIDFTLCNTHTGQHLPLAPYQVDYINEKLECIFTGRSIMMTDTKNEEKKAKNERNTY